MKIRLLAFSLLASYSSISQADSSLEGYSQVCGVQVKLENIITYGDNFVTPSSLINFLRENFKCEPKVCIIPRALVVVCNANNSGNYYAYTYPLNN